MTTATAQPSSGQMSLAKRPPYSPLAPIGDASALKSLLNSQREGIAQALPKHVTPERIIKTMLVAANRIPDLLKCTQASILETINRAAELGLDLSGTLGEAYPVPFKNKVRGPNGQEVSATQCTLIIGYRGLAKLAWQSNDIKRIEAEVVCANDHFVYRKGANFQLDFIPSLDGERGEAIGAYALVELKAGGIMAEFMTKADIEKIREKAKSRNSPAWSDPQSRLEMYRKTVFRRLAKWLPLSTEKFVAAIEHDNTDFEMTEVLEAETVRAATPPPDGKASFGRRAQVAQQPPAAKQPAYEPEPEPMPDEPGEPVMDVGDVEDGPQEAADEPEATQDDDGVVRTLPQSWVDDYDQFCGYAATFAPPEHQLTYLEIKNQVGLLLRKPWQKLSVAEKQESLDKLNAGKMQWRPGKKAASSGA